MSRCTNKSTSALNLSWLIVCLWTVLTNFKAEFAREFALSTPALVTGIKSISDRIVLIHWKYYPFRVTADCCCAYVRALHLRHHGHDGQTSLNYEGGGWFSFFFHVFLLGFFHSGGCTPAPFLYAGSFPPPLFFPPFFFFFFFFFPLSHRGGVRRLHPPLDPRLQILFLIGLLFNKIQYQHDQSESEVNMASLRAAASATTWSFFWKYMIFNFWTKKAKLWQYNI